MCYENPQRRETECRMQLMNSSEHKINNNGHRDQSEELLSKRAVHRLHIYHQIEISVNVQLCRDPSSLGGRSLAFGESFLTKEAKSCCLFAREFEGACSGAVSSGGSRGTAGSRPGAQLRAHSWTRRSLATLNLAVAGAIWSSRDSLALPSQLLQLGANKVRVLLLSRAWARTAAAGAEVGQKWSDPITLKMKGWGWLALFLGILLGTAWAQRSQDLHCGGKGTKTRSGRKPTLGGC
ncbi:uncharacterized protein LOC132649082 [Meriones unguiculatus]|uniref:uncharacterized protein LOC132649082 n=1 Tax=Meriones unguiculatus TaxID=10047 RepID=UPI00293F0FDC|nr:uncharacterized protein LOC132649082 [Meriones unguiculatus]